MALEPLTKQEHGEVAQLLTSYWQERGMTQYDRKWAASYLIEGHKKEIEKDEFFVYKENGTIIGTIALITYSGGVAEIRDLVIKQEHRKKGQGKKVLSEIISIARQRKLRKLFAFVNPELEAPLQKGGFVKEGVLKNHFAQGEDLVIMSLFL